MIRIVALLICIVAAWAALVWLLGFLRERDVDWRGVAFAVGFVALAFWLRAATGIG